MEPDWQKIYLQLYTFADQILKNYTWFRGDNTDSFMEGKQAHDYATDAIEIYLRAPEKFDPTKRSLIGYLKKHILRRLVFNDANSSENNTTKNALRIDEDDNEVDLIDLYFSRTDSCFDQELDFDKIMAEIEDGLKDDPVASLIFEGKGRNWQKRREIMEEKNLSDTEYDMGMKRLKTILRQVIKKYEINEPKRVKKKETNRESI